MKVYWWADITRRIQDTTHKTLVWKGFFFFYLCSTMRRMHCIQYTMNISELKHTPTHQLMKLVLQFIRHIGFTIHQTRQFIRHIGFTIYQTRQFIRHIGFSIYQTHQFIRHIRFTIYQKHHQLMKLIRHLSTHQVM